MKMKDDKLKFIMNYALMQFKTRGYSKVTMDEISSATGTGKGTLYKYFPSKEDLLINSLDLFITQIKQTLNDKLENDLNPMEKLQNFISFISEILKPIDATNLADIERNVPKAYKKLNEAREDIIFGNLCSILEEGKTKDVFLKDLDGVLVSYIIIGAAEYISRQENLQNLPYVNMNVIFNSVLKTVLEGCLTENSRNSFNQSKS